MFDTIISRLRSTPSAIRKIKFSSPAEDSFSPYSFQFPTATATSPETAKC
jgi:hypothetical protein